MDFCQTVEALTFVVCMTLLLDDIAVNTIIILSRICRGRVCIIYSTSVTFGEKKEAPSNLGLGYLLSVSFQVFPAHGIRCLVWSGWIVMEMLASRCGSRALDNLLLGGDMEL